MQSASYQTGQITATTSEFEWVGGKTSFSVAGNFTGGLNVVLQALGPDHSTYLDVITKTAAGLTVADLPRGQYRIELNTGTSTGLNCQLVRIV